MLRYFIKRLLWLIPVMIGVITIVFAITVLMPGDPAASLLDQNATQEQIDEVHARLGLDKPVVVRWLDYVVGIFTEFDFGTSYFTQQPVRDEVLAKLPYTLILAVYPPFKILYHALAGKAMTGCKHGFTRSLGGG